MERIVGIAEQAGQPVLRPNSVTAAHDFLSVKVPIARSRSQVQEEEEQPGKQQQQSGDAVGPVGAQLLIER
jgi:hypothetical protein